MTLTPERWQKIEQLYHSALAHDASLRAGYLREVCASDDALRREVESLLAEDGRAEHFFERPALRTAAKVLAAQQSESSLVGRQLGSYKIISLLGVGGMGEVYQARDTKLNRDVAIKILPAGFVHDAERLARFQREARMLAALNHPNVATIHGMERSGEIDFLVMEQVPGETLAERLKLGPVGVEDGLKIGEQIAEALEAAHEKGMIHRDLKPANVKVTPDGRVKILDFGLAKALSGEGVAVRPSERALDPVGTEEGRIVGTPAYMSPEQARGKPVDKRTDIWAFGCVLYELLTGRQAFHGDTLSDMIVSILEREPEWQLLPPSTPVKIRELLGRCLQKDPRQRVHDAADARIEIEEALAVPAALGAVAPRKGIRTPGRRALLAIAGAFLLVAVVTGFAMRILKLGTAEPPKLVTRFAIMLPSGQRLAVPDNGPAVVLSPDGNYLAYMVLEGGARRIYLRAMGSLEAKLVPGGESAENPFFSPDSKWLAFGADNKLKKISVDGVSPIDLFDCHGPYGASWSPQNGMILGSYQGPLMQVWDAGSTPVPFTRLEKGETSHAYPDLLPGGKAFLFSASLSGSFWTNAQIAVQRIGSGERQNLFQGGLYPHYALSGHLVYSKAGSLMAAPFDLQKLALTGAAVPVVEGVQESTRYGDAQFSFSSTGSLAYIPGTVQFPRFKMVWVTRSGAERPLAAPVHAYLQPRISPNGQQVAVGLGEQERQIWLYDVSRDTLTRFTFQGNNNLVPFWTPDGKRIAFTSSSEGPRNLFWQRSDGSGGLERLTTSDYLHLPGSWSPDGQLLAYSEVNSTTGYDIWVLRISDHTAQPFLQTQFNEAAPQFSPDGRWLAYSSNESGRNEIYVRPYPGPGGKWQISTEGGVEPLWNRNGRELFYRDGPKMMAVEIATKPSFSAGAPKMLFERQYAMPPNSTPDYDVSPDGQRFLMLKDAEPEQGAASQINIVLNWFEELKQKVPVTGK